MATRKQMRKRTRKQRGGGLLDSLKELLSKLLPTKKEPLLTTEKERSASAASAASGSVAIPVQNTPPAPPAVKVNKPLTPQTSVNAATPPSGLSGSFTAPIVSSGPPSQVAVQTGTPPGSFMQPPKLTGGKRKKHRHTRRRSLHNKRK